MIQVQRLPLLFSLVASMTLAIELPAVAEIGWQSSPQQTLRAARLSGKPILVFVTTDWCHYCKKMKHETWSVPQVEAAVSRNFETLVLDGDRDKRVVQQLGLRGYPATLVFDPNGNFVAQKDGFMPPGIAMKWLSDVVRP